MKKWLKNTFVKEHETSVGARNTILQNIDISCVYQNHLVIRGWCLDEMNSPIHISVMTKAGQPLPLLFERKVPRIDVLAHLSMDYHGQLVGFSHVYRIENISEEITINFGSEYEDLIIPLDLSQITVEQAKLECQSLGIQFSDDESMSEKLDTYDAIIKQETNIAREKETENKAISKQEPEPNQTYEIDSHQVVDQDLVQKIEQQEKSEIKQESKMMMPIHYHIDEAGVYKGKIALVRGWCLDSESHKNVDISATHEGNHIEIIKQFDIDRPDVKNHFKTGNQPYSYGFSLLLDISKFDINAIKLHFTSGEHSIAIVEPLTKELSREHLENNLVDGSDLAESDCRLFLIEQLGSSYIEDLESAYVDTNQINTKLYIDTGLSLEGGLFIRGWIDDSHREVASIKLTDGKVVSANIHPNLNRNVRADVNEAFPHLPADFKSGFFSFVELENFSAPLHAIIIDKSGKLVKQSIEVSQSLGDEVTATQQILEPIDPHSPELFDIYEQHVAPTLHSIWKSRTKPKSKDQVSVIQYGNEIKNPICSFIIPLYGRYDFVLHQLAQFELDDDFQEIEIIYVIDDPRIDQATKSMCDDIAKLYNISFKVVSCGQNLGFAGANNLGVEYATSEHLLLLNSDVLPSKSGWLRRVLDTYKSQDNIGALGMKLVFEDESIQHIGMSFIKSREFGGLWLNDHPYKGLPQALVPEVTLKSVPTVTAACLLIETSKYKEIGGFDTQYILGDFEDSDLCLKLLDAGYENYILGTEKLYHLERLSQSLVQQGDWKFKLTLFNGWQHTKRWDQLISSIEAQA